MDSRVMHLDSIRIPSADIELVRVTGEFTYPWHCHTAHWVVGAVLRGQCTLTTTGKTRYPAWFAIPPLTGHSLRLGPDATLVTATFGSRPDRPIDQISLLGIIHDALERCDWEADQITTALLPAIAGATFQVPRPSWVVALLDRLDNEVTDPTVTELAAEFRLSPGYLTRVCAAQTGLTPHQLRMQYRLRRAQNYLAEGATVADAAYQAGFFDQSHLNRVFRRAVGPTPVAYRRAVVTV